PDGAGGGRPDAENGQDGRTTSDDAADGATTDGRDAASDAPFDEILGKSTIVFAAPDLKPQYVCIAAFDADANGEPIGEIQPLRGPSGVVGPFGVPDPSDPTKKRLISGFPYGAIVPIGTYMHDVGIQNAFAHRVFAAFLLDDDPGA